MTNILQNWTFETDFSGWGITGSPSVLEIYASPLKGNVARIQPRVDTSGNSVETDLYQTFRPLTAGTYTMSIEAVLTSTSANPQAMGVYLMNLTTGAGIIYKRLDLSTTWTTYSFEVTVLQSTDVRFFLQFFSNHIFQIDNVILDSPSAVMKYACVNNQCVQDVNGPYATLAECQAACQPIPVCSAPSFNYTVAEV